MAIYAPYNFVPVDDKVFFPEWGNSISHDIPFEDEKSGYLTVCIEAKTPIFVRNGNNRDEVRTSENYKLFSSTPDGEFFIPATAIKGELRTTLSILSFGKLSIINNKRYAIRDLRNRKYLEQINSNNIHCGWMSFDASRKNIIISDRGIPRRISHRQIDEKYNTTFCSIFSNPSTLKNEAKRSSLYKYELLRNQSLTNNFSELRVNNSNTVDNRKFVKFDPNGTPGTLVLTGQASRRDPSKSGQNNGKYYEFVFMQKEIASYTFDIFEENGLYEDFCFIYKDSKEWNYWHNKMSNGESIPVFFLVIDNKIQHLGLSFLYKLPFRNRINAYLGNAHSSTRRDLADCIWGCLDSNDGLKGRVSISHAMCLKSITFPEQNPYCASPKPTYYPIYLNQIGTNGIMEDRFKTMLDSDAKIKGWKRYPVREQVTTNFTIPQGQENNTSPFRPLDKGSLFECRIIFHNLKEEELGALIDSIELKDDCWHSIGFAKPHGYGAVKMKIDYERSLGVTKEQSENYRNAFINMMTSFDKNYLKSRQLRELYTMSQPNEYSQPLEYMELGQFAEEKKQNFKRDITGCYLPYASELLLHKEQQNNSKNQPLTFEAEIVLVSGQLIQAKLINHKDTSTKKLTFNGDKPKLKKGEKVCVNAIQKGGNIIELKFVSKKQ